MFPKTVKMSCENCGEVTTWEKVNDTMYKCLKCRQMYLSTNSKQFRQAFSNGKKP